MKKGRFRLGMKGLMVGVASCALIIWAGLSIRDHLEGYQPLRVIRSGNAVERRTAARDLFHEQGIDAEEAMAALVRLLDDEDAGVRAMAAETLGSFVYKLPDPPPTASVASDLLKRRIDVATRGLVPLLSDRDPDVRAAAATGLGTRPIPARAAPQQLAALLDGSNAVRRQAARMIYGAPDVTLPPELVAALKDESAEVRSAAARALVRFGPDLDPEIPALITMMERDETNVRKACALALEAAWPTPALVPTLIGFLKSRDRDVRFHAAQLLGRIGPDARAAIPVLIAVLKEPLGASYPDPARGAARALGQMGPRREAIAALVEVISPEKVERNLSAWQKLGPLLAARKGLADSKPPALQVRAVGAESLRIMAAMHGLGDIGPPAVAAVPALISAYNKALGTHHTMTQVAIPMALGRIAPNSAAAPNAVAVLIRALDSKDPSVRLGAVEALGHFGTAAAAAIPKLRALQEEYSFFRKFVAKSGSGSLLPGSPFYLEISIHNTAAKSLAALEAQSKPDAGGERGRRRP
jgi:HEAT repeat protein